VTVVALTGGIAAGKTTVTDVLRARGVDVVDADVLAREAVAKGSPALEAIVNAFGAGVLDDEGSLDRTQLAQKVFADSQAREVLNAIVHPEVHRLSHEAFAAHERENPDVPLVYAVPLLVESSRTNEFDAIVVVHAPRELRIARLVETRGMTPEEATARVDAQASDEERLAAAGSVLDSSRSLEDTRVASEALADALWSVWPDVSKLPTRLP
jgi:dephospho-CoA kinase